MAANRKYGLDLCLCLNDLSQLKEMYPRTFHSFVGSCGVLQVMSAIDDETSEFVSKLCGEREVMTIGRTVNTSPIYDYDAPVQAGMDKMGVSDQKGMSVRKLILPHEVRSLGPREQIMRVAGVKNYVRCNRKPHFEDPELAKRARKNPFYRKAV